MFWLLQKVRCRQLQVVRSTAMNVMRFTKVFMPFADAIMQLKKALISLPVGVCSINCVN